MNFKEESAGINDTISKLLGFSDGDIIPDTKPIDFTKEPAQEETKEAPNTIHLQDRVKQIEEERRLKDLQAQEEIERLRRESLAKIQNANKDLNIPEVPKLKEETKKTEIKTKESLQDSINNTVIVNVIEEKKEKTEVSNIEPIEEKKPQIEEVSEEIKIVNKPVVEEEPIKTKSNQVQLEKKEKRNSMKVKSPTKSKTPDKTTSKPKRKEIKLTIPPLKLKKTHKKTVSADISIPSTKRQRVKYDPYKTENFKNKGPNTTRNSVDKSLNQSRNVNDIYSRFQTHRKEREEKIESIRKQRETMEAKELTGKPKININSKMILSKITKDFYQRQLSFEKKKRAKTEKLAEELKRKKEEELTKSIIHVSKGKKGDFNNKLSEFKEWEKKKQERLIQLKKEKEKKEKSELRMSNKKPKREIEETCNRLYKEDMNKRHQKKYILHQVYRPTFTPFTNSHSSHKRQLTIDTDRDTSHDQKKESIFTKEDKKLQTILRKRMFGHHIPKKDTLSTTFDNI